MKLDKREVTVRKYCVEVSIEFFQALIAKDDAHIHEEGADMITLCDRLNKVDGLVEVDYDGHFGPNLFFDVEAADDTPELWTKIEDIINDYLEGK